MVSSPSSPNSILCSPSTHSVFSLSDNNNYDPNSVIQIKNNKDIQVLLVSFKNLILFEGINKKLIKKFQEINNNSPSASQNQYNQKNQSFNQKQSLGSRFSLGDHLSSFGTSLSPKNKVKVDSSKKSFNDIDNLMQIQEEHYDSNCNLDRDSVVRSSIGYKSMQNEFINSPPVSSNEITLHFRTDDQFLLRFLHVTKYDISLAVKRYTEYYLTIFEIPKIIDLLHHNFTWFSTSNSFIAKNPPFNYTAMTKKEGGY